MKKIILLITFILLMFFCIKFTYGIFKPKNQPIISTTYNNSLSLKHKEEASVNKSNKIQRKILIKSTKQNSKIPKNIENEVKIPSKKDIQNQVLVSTLKDLDKPLECVYMIMPEYPKSLREKALESSVLIKFLVNEKGKIEDIILLDPKINSLFEESIIRAMSQWKFIPPTVNNQKSKVWVTKPIKFKLK